MLVTRIIGSCPRCGATEAFGNVMVNGDHVLRGCTQCRFSQKIQLPALDKQIIYLDQFFFSSAFRERDSRFIEAARLIKQATEDQVLLAPFSSIHEDETHLWRGFDEFKKEDLMQFIKATSRGHEFAPPYKVENDNIISAFNAFLRGEASEFNLNRWTALPAEVNRWEDYFRIDIGRYRGNTELIRDLKRQNVDELIDVVFPAWRKSTITFDENVAHERRVAAASYLRYYSAYVQRIAAGDYNALFDSPIASMIVQNMLRVMPEEMEISEQFRRVSEFFASAHFAEVPNEWISTRIFSVLREQVKNGAYRDPEKAKSRLSGFVNDVAHVSTYAPYVNAIVVDQPMAAILDDRRVKMTNRYGTLVFSLNNWEDLLAWLQALTTSVSVEHRRGLELAYP